MAYSQAERMCQVSSPLGDDALLLSNLTAVESLSSPFRYDMQFVSEKDDIEFASLVGKPLSVHLTLANGNERHFHGIVSRFSQGNTQGRFSAYHAVVVPWLELLRRRTNNRIYQHKTVPDIIKALLSELGYGDFEFQLSGDYPEREYCVQFGESDLAFISRLAESEGLGYFFKHSEKQHTLVFFDSPSANPPVPGQATVMYAAAEDKSAPGGAVRSWSHQYEFRPGKYALSDFNFEDPGMNLLTQTSTSKAVGGNDKFEVYEFPGKYVQLSEGERRVKLRMQAEEAAAVRIEAQGECAAFTPGYRFDLQGHSRQSFNGSYVITQVVHQVSQDVTDSGTPSSYSNAFNCAPHSLPQRPLCTAERPLITGVQTATVVGASGKEIDVDKHGRVVVQFHWDREGKKDENSSCRVRVAQNWAGKGWGLVANPRIGQEVIVEFIDGDPDRPIITGRVYNGEQVMAWGIPSSDTQTGFVSRSSPGGSADHANIWRFEDKKGAEHILLHAEKDNLIEVENDENHSVGHDRSITVDNDETHDVKKDRTRSVGGDEQVTIQGNRTVTVAKRHEESVTGNEALTVAKSRTRNVSENETIQIGKDQSLTIEGARVLLVKKEQTIQVEKDQEESIGGRSQTSVTKEYLLQAKKIQLVAEDEISITAGSAEIVMKKNGDITVNGKKISIEGSGDVIVKGSKVAVN